MLNLASMSLCLRERAGERRNLRDTARWRSTLTPGANLGTTVLEAAGLADGTTGAAMLGIGGGGIFAALPMPLGSLSELLRPPTLPGPRGMPLTPASPAPCANSGAGTADKPSNVTATKADLRSIDHTSRRAALRKRNGPSAG